VTLSFISADSLFIIILFPWNKTMNSRDAYITSIKGVGSKMAELFAKVDVFTVNDLLEYYPRDYKSYPAPVSIASVKVGDMVAISGQITDSLSILGSSRKKIITCHVSDGQGVLSLTWFNALFLKNVLRKGGHYVFYGRVRQYKGALSMEHPEYFTIEDYKLKMGHLLPVYVKTAGLSDNSIIKFVRQAMGEGVSKREYITQDLLDSMNLMDLDMAIRQVHFPDSREKLERARKRIAFDELFFFLLEIKSMKALTEEETVGIIISDFKAGRDFVKSLPFDLTAGQKSTIKEIEKDLASGHIMRRIIQGDVGSGKTVVALRAMIDVCRAGYQAAMMAPTEVLSSQHYETIREYFEKYDIDIEVALLTGSTKKRERDAIYEGLSTGRIGIVVGTHAIIQEGVTFGKLGLVITDEQHRFGVKQRDFLAKKGAFPHVLVMSATPIPRTLGLILYGDMDISLIKDMPAERLPIKNCVVGRESRQTSYNFIKKEIAAGHQAFIICPLVEESENMDVCDVISYSADLRRQMPGVTVEYLHGKMKNSEKNDIMERFAAGDIDVLVSTTVIEVGINVPNATVMMIEDADRFGLATLHQLRGRVGRGAAQGYCIMINGSGSDKSKERLDIMNKSNDGFYIANEDLKSRGIGDMLGLRQSGEMSFKMADIYEDADILKLASRLADDVLPKMNEKEAADNPFISEVYSRFKKAAENSRIDAL